MSEPFLGEIRMFGGNFAPRGWALCNGQLLPISQNTALFSILGTTYGGDGRVTFGLPNLQGRLPMHWGSGPGLTPRTIGEMAGVETVTLISSEMPMHTHLVQANSAAGAQTAATGNFIASASDPNSGSVFPSFETTANTQLNPQSVGLAGGNQPHENMSPFLCVTFIIALEGIFPSRN